MSQPWSEFLADRAGPQFLVPSWNRFWSCLHLFLLAHFILVALVPCYSSSIHAQQVCLSQDVCNCCFCSWKSFHPMIWMFFYLLCTLFKPHLLMDDFSEHLTENGIPYLPLFTHSQTTLLLYVCYDMCVSMWMCCAVCVVHVEVPMPMCERPCREQSRLSGVFHFYSPRLRIHRLLPPVLGYRHTVILSLWCGC